MTVRLPAAPAGVLASHGANMPRIDYTHGYDLAFTVTGIMGVISGAAAANGAAQEILDIDTWPKQLDHVKLVVLIGSSLGGLIGASIVFRRLREWIPTFLYARLNLGIPITREDAKKVSFLFDGSMDGNWLKLRDFKEIPGPFRYIMLLHTANKVAAEMGYATPYPGLSQMPRKQENCGA